MLYRVNVYPPIIGLLSLEGDGTIPLAPTPTFDTEVGQESPPPPEASSPAPVVASDGDGYNYKVRPAS